MRHDTGSYYLGWATRQNRGPHINTPMTGTMTTDITLSMNVLEDPSWPEFEIPRESSLGYPHRAPAVLSLATRRSDTLERAAEAHSKNLRQSSSVKENFVAVSRLAVLRPRPMAAEHRHGETQQAMQESCEILGS